MYRCACAAVLVLAGGLFLDWRGSRTGAVLFCLLALIGHLIFTAAIHSHSYIGAVLGRVIFGLGQGSSVVAQGKIAAHWFVGRELTLAIGVSESVHNASGWFAKLPVSEWFGNYYAALWVGVGACALSLIAALLYFKIDRRAEAIFKANENRSQHSIARAALHRQHQIRRQGSTTALPPPANSPPIAGTATAPLDQPHTISFAGSDSPPPAAAASVGGPIEPPHATPGSTTVDPAPPPPKRNVSDGAHVPRPFYPDSHDSSMSEIWQFGCRFWLVLGCHMMFSNSFRTSIDAASSVCYVFEHCAEAVLCCCCACEQICSVTYPLISYMIGGTIRSNEPRG